MTKKSPTKAASSFAKMKRLDARISRAFDRIKRLEGLAVLKSTRSSGSSAEEEEE